MNLQEYQEKLENSKQLSYVSKHIFQFIEVFCDLTELENLNYYKYEYEYNEFFHQVSYDKNGLNKKKIEYDNNSYKIILKNKKIIYGYLKIPKRIKSTPLVKKILSKISLLLKEEVEIQKKLLGNDIPFSIYLIHDSFEPFANNLKSGLEGIFNIDVTLDISINKHLDKFKNKESKNIIILLIKDQEFIKKYEDKLKVLNELIIVIGPNDHHISMYCGKLGIDDYISINEFKALNLKSIITNKRNTLLNKNKFGNKIIAISGISGGIGTTSIAMNMSDLIANNQTNKNILYIDLSTTKAISNLFLEKNPLPNKTIIDLINSNEFNIENNLENGLVKLKENFYCITGIQKQIEKDFIEKENFIEKFLQYISSASEYFNFIIIDVGVADSSDLKSTIYDIVNELWLVTEMTLPHISKLKTFYSLMKRAGLKDKITFVVNRCDSQNAISVNDVTSILNMNNEDKIQFDSFKIPNDYKTLGKCWNYCELVSRKEKNSLFIKKLEYLLQNKGLYSVKDTKSTSRSFFSFLKKAK